MKRLLAILLALGLILGLLAGCGDGGEGGENGGGENKSPSVTLTNDIVGYVTTFYYPEEGITVEEDEYLGNPTYRFIDEAAGYYIEVHLTNYPDYIIEEDRMPNNENIAFGENVGWIDGVYSYSLDGDLVVPIVNDDSEQGLVGFQIYRTDRAAAEEDELRAFMAGDTAQYILTNLSSISTRSADASAEEAAEE